MTLNIMTAISIIMIVLALGVVGYDIYSEYTQNKIIYDNVDPGSIVGVDYDRVSKISCHSDSMGLVYRCKDQVFSRSIEKNETFIEGDVYIYKKPDKNNSIIHRLALCLDDNCNEMVFRGDNNAKGELVYREEVIAKPIAQMFN